MSSVWNVLTSDWLDVTGLQSSLKVVSPLDALRNAQNIKCISLANPLDLFAAHRFLLTLLYWRADSDGGVERLREKLLGGEVPQSLIDNIEDEGERFEVFHESAPFLQEASAQSKDPKPAGSLFSELATGTGIAHFQHGDDDNMKLCLKCLTLGMLRVVPFTQSGGSGLSPSVHGAPPILALAQGENLAITLGLNLVPLPAQPGKAKWTGEFVPDDKEGKINFMEAFTWNPRTMKVPEPQAIEKCWSCGAVNVTGVGKIIFNKNPNTKKRDDKKPFEWHDPSAFYMKNKEYTTYKSTKEDMASSGSDLFHLANKEAQPESIVAMKNSNHRKWTLIVPCTNPANNKTFDHRKLEITSLDPPILKEQLQKEKKPPEPVGLDGWESPRNRASPGENEFIKSTSELTTEQWTTIQAAAFSEMNEAPAAFVILTSILWRLRKKAKGVPAKNVSWLVLKLMSSMPSELRAYHQRASYNPIDLLPKRQQGERKKGKFSKSNYPVTFPRGNRLEAELRRELEKNMRQRSPRHIDWVGLCSGLDQIIG